MGIKQITNKDVSEMRTRQKQRIAAPGDKPDIFVKRAQDVPEVA